MRVLYYIFAVAVFSLQSHCGLLVNRHEYFYDLYLYILNIRGSINFAVTKQIALTRLSIHDILVPAQQK